MAIPINELRIGNMFWEDYGGYKIVTAIGFNNVGKFPNHVQGRAIGGKVSGLFDADKIDPVPLSVEVLEACGFAKGVDNKCRLGDDDFFYVYGSKGFYAPNVMPEITSLHQLQNLYFALTSKELNYQP